MKPEPRKGARPTHELFVVEPPKEGATDKEGKPAKGFFTKVGAAWLTKSGEGFNIKLTALPLDGLLTMVPIKDPE